MDGAEAIATQNHADSWADYFPTEEAVKTSFTIVAVTCAVISLSLHLHHVNAIATYTTAGVSGSIGLALVVYYVVKFCQNKIKLNEMNRFRRGVLKRYTAEEILKSKVEKEIAAIKEPNAALRSKQIAEKRRELDVELEKVRNSDLKKQIAALKAVDPKNCSMHEAIKKLKPNDAFEIVSRHIREGTLIDAVDRQGSTPLGLVLETHDPLGHPLFEYLLARGADAKKLNIFGQAPIHIALKSLQLTKRLVKYDPSVLSCPDIFGRTPLQRVLMEKNPSEEMIRLLQRP